MHYFDYIKGIILLLSYIGFFFFFQMKNRKYYYYYAADFDQKSALFLYGHLHFKSVMVYSCQSLSLSSACDMLFCLDCLLQLTA
jgi:hypothetical protein